MLNAVTFFLVWMLAGSAGHTAGVAVPLATGEVRGEERQGALLFPHIAYAEPPVGSLRWRRSVPAAKVRQLAAPVQCPQVISDSLPGSPLPSSEDCLYLNVWAPPAAKKLPVVFLIHGGGLLAGSGLKDFYDGSVFARRGVIFVSFNYRLGELGYGPDLEKAPGSLGLLDQGLALRWVTENIAAFGGDPDRIFLMGHSKGAEAVTALAISGLAGPNVKGGIALSGPRQFDEGGDAPKLGFWPGEKDADWKTILTKRGFHLYIPILPAHRAHHASVPPFRLLVSSLYDERMSGGEVELYCANLHHLFRFPRWLEAYHYVWHTPVSEHGAEVIAMFREEAFGRELLRHVLEFVRTGEPPRIFARGAVPLWRTRKEEVHVYPAFSFTRSVPTPSDDRSGMKFIDYARNICLDRKYGGSKIGPAFWKLESALRWWRSL